MFGLGFGEIVVIVVLALVLLGPQKLPEVAKQAGKALRDFRKATDGLKEQFERELYAEDDKFRKPRIAPPSAGSPVPTAPAGPVPLATAENVPGLEAALAEPGAASVNPPPPAPLPPPSPPTDAGPGPRA